MTAINQIIRIGRVERVITGAKTIVNKNGKTYVDGKLLDDLDINKMPEKEINITITGDIERLEVDYCERIQVNGSVKRINTTSGDVEVSGNVDGDVETVSGDVDIEGNVDGNVKTVSGDVECLDVSGSVSTMSGDITHA